MSSSVTGLEGSIYSHVTRAHLQQSELRFHVSKPAREASEDGLRFNSSRRDCLNLRRASFWFIGQQKQGSPERYKMLTMAARNWKANHAIFLCVL